MRRRRVRLPTQLSPWPSLKGVWSNAALPRTRLPGAALGTMVSHSSLPDPRARSRRAYPTTTPTTARATAPLGSRSNVARRHRYIRSPARFVRQPKIRPTARPAALLRRVPPRMPSPPNASRSSPASAPASATRSLIAANRPAVRSALDQSGCGVVSVAGVPHSVVDTGAAPKTRPMARPSSCADKARRPPSTVPRPTSLRNSAPTIRWAADAMVLNVVDRSLTLASAACAARSRQRRRG